MQKQYICNGFFIRFFIIALFAGMPLTGSAEVNMLPATESCSLFDEIPSVFSASKYEQKTTEAPSVVNIVTADEIKRKGFRTFADILNSVRGFYITSDRNYQYLGVRGFCRPGDYNTRILVMIDGQRMNEVVYDSALIGTSYIHDLDLIERVEVIRGPSSSLYGTNAFFGVVNVITKRGRDFQGVELSGEVGSLSTYKTRVSYGDRFSNGIETLVSGTYYSSKGNSSLYYKEFDDPDNNNGVAENGDQDEYYSLFSKSAYSGVNLEVLFSNRDKKIPTGAFYTLFNDPRNMTEDRQFLINLSYEHFFSEHTELKNQIYYGNYAYYGYYVYDESETDEPDIAVNNDFSNAKWLGGEVQIIHNWMELHKLISGIEYRYNLQQDQGNYTREEVYLDSREKSSSLGMYLQDEFQLFDLLRFNLGVRYDHYSTYGDTVNPRLALIFNPIDKNTIKLLYGRAFRAPSIYELYYDDGGYSQKSNPELQPEKIETYEAVMEQFVGNDFHGTVTGFYYRLENLIDLEIDPADGYMFFNNTQEVEVKGLELELEGKLINSLEGSICYTYQNAVDKQTNVILTNSPNNMVKVSLVYSVLKDKISIGLEEQYLSPRTTLAGLGTDSQYLTNITLFTERFIKGLDISAGVYNLFDADYGDPGSAEHLQDIITQNGRTYRLKLVWSFN